jgi:hypothetical protein
MNIALSHAVIPAMRFFNGRRAGQAGIQRLSGAQNMDSRFRGNDGKSVRSTYCQR